MEKLVSNTGTKTWEQAGSVVRVISPLARYNTRLKCIERSNDWGHTTFLSIGQSKTSCWLYEWSLHVKASGVIQFSTDEVFSQPLISSLKATSSLKSSSLSISQEFKQFGRNCDLHECFWRWVFLFETSHFLYNYRISSGAQRHKASTCVEMSWYFMVGTEIWHLNGYASPPTAAIWVSARRRPRFEFPFAERRNTGFRWPAAERKGSSGNQTKRGLWYQQCLYPLCKNLIWSNLAVLYCSSDCDKSVSGSSSVPTSSFCMRSLEILVVWTIPDFGSPEVEKIVFQVPQILPVKC